MGNSELRNQLKSLLEYANDEEMIHAFEELIVNYQNNSTNSFLSTSQLKELDAIRERHFAEKSKSYSWEEIKKEISEKHGI